MKGHTSDSTHRDIHVTAVRNFEKSKRKRKERGSGCTVLYVLCARAHTLYLVHDIDIILYHIISYQISYDMICCWGEIS